MAQAKTSFARLKGIEAGSLPALATRLSKISFDINCEYKVIALDREFPRLGLDVVQRKTRQIQRYDDAQGKLVKEERNEDRIHDFRFDADSGVASTSGGRRDFALLLELFKRAGAGQADIQPLVADLWPWLKELLKMYDAPQLTQLVLDNMFVEPRLLGRYTAKTLDNRLDLKFIEEHAGKLRSLKLGLFVEGIRRTVEARQDGVITVSSADLDDLEHFSMEQHKLFLKHAAVSEAQE